jgi:hypothetical protein
LNVDDSLRRSLNEYAPRPELPVEDLLRDALARGRRRRAANLVVGGGAVTILIAAIAWAVIVGVFEGDGAPSQPASPVISLAGTYSSSVEQTEPRAASLGLVGTYSISITRAGVLDIDGPEPFEARWTSPAGPLEIADGTVRVFTLQGHCGDFGTYRFEVGNSGSVTFSSISDDCLFRRLLLAREWIPSGS